MKSNGEHIAPVKNMRTEFRIFTFDITDQESINSAPHRHNFHEIIFLQEGEASHEIDGEQYQVKGPEVILVAQGKVHSFKVRPGAKGYIVRFAGSFLPENTECLFSQFFFLSNIPVRCEEFRQKITGLLQLILNADNEPDRKPAFIKYLLSAYVELLKDEKEKHFASANKSSKENYQLFNRFLMLVENHFHDQQPVDFYAKTLNVTPRKLGEISKEVFGLSSSNVIDSRLMLEAKRLLLYTPQSIQEITYTLGFSDQSYFTKTFRKREGLTPSEYRTRNKVA